MDWSNITKAVVLAGATAGKDGLFLFSGSGTDGRFLLFEVQSRWSFSAIWRAEWKLFWGCQAIE